MSISRPATASPATVSSVVERFVQALSTPKSWVIAASLGLAALASGVSSPVFAQAAPAPAAAEAPKSIAQAAAAAADAPSPYGLRALWEQGDAVAHTTLVILVIMSLGTWYIIVTKLVDLAKIRRQGNTAMKSFFSAPTVEQGLSTLKEESPFRFVANAGMEATRKHEGLLAHIGFSDWVTMSVQRATDAVQSRMQDGLAFLATVASTAPFVGLFGTVWGIYNALVKIGISGQASIDKVAGPVGEALIMTAIGLAVAVPAVLGYNFIVRRNKTTMDQVRAFGADMHAVLLGSQAKK
jgi:biopolymer transport protein ExbB